MRFPQRVGAWLKSRTADDVGRSELGLAYRGISFRTTYEIPTEQQLDQALQPTQRARAAGAQNNPPTAQRELSADEDAIVLFFKKILRNAEHRVFDALSTLRNDLEREQATVTLPNVDRAFANLDAELRTLKLEHAGRLIEVNKDRLEAWRTLRHFRATHGINRDAVYPESFIFDFMLLFALVALETIGNAFFYQYGNERGFAGGLGNAFIISVVNVFMAFFVVGYVSLRHLQVRRVALRLAAMAGAVGGIIGIVLLNLAAAHYRDLLSADPQRQFVNAATEVYTRGFALDTLQALALLLFGYTLAIFAAYKGYFYDDPLPGFGTVTRRYEQAKARQRDAELAFRTALNNASRDHAASVEQELLAFHASVQGRQTAIAVYDQIRGYFPDYQSNVIQRMCHATLRRYREENARVRTSEVPVCFSEYPDLMVPFVLPDLPAQLRDLRQQIADLRTADEAFSQLKSDFLARVETFFASIETAIASLEEMARARLDRREPLT
jgi:tetratricopeptide (TPR) repeat protein